MFISNLHQSNRTYEHAFVFQLFCMCLICFSFLCQSTLLSVIDCVDLIYVHSPASTLSPLDAVYHRALRFITGDGFRTHYCLLHQKAGWQSLAVRREQLLLANCLNIFHVRSHCTRPKRLFGP